MSDLKSKIGLISDTHENMPAISKAIDKFNDYEVDLVLHAGDFISPITVNEFKKLNSDLIGVFGNNDGDRLLLRRKFSEENVGRIERDPYEFQLDGKKIYLMHQPKFMDSLRDSSTVDIVIYGHTHEVELSNNRPLVVNPGECCGWLTGKSTIGILKLEDLDVEIIEL